MLSTTNDSGQSVQINLEACDMQREEATDKIRLQRMFGDICRCCLTKYEDLTLIFDPNQYISYTIHQFTGVEINENDGFPNKVCTTCVNNLNVCIGFKQQCEISDMLLKQFVSEGYRNGMVLQPVAIDNVDIYLSANNSTNPVEDHICLEDNVINLEIIDLSKPSSFEVNANQSVPSDQNSSDLFNKDNFYTSKSDEESKKSEKITLNCRSEHVAVNESKSLFENDQQQSEYAEKKSHLLHSGNSKTCDICLRSFANKMTYKRHMNIHTSKTELFYCAKCTRKFSNKKVFDHHMRCHNQTIIEKANQETFTYCCSICKYECFAEKDLNIHSSLHSEELKPTCRGCNKTFSDKIKLKRHLPIHFKEKPFKCDICLKGFPEMGSLTRHFKKHTNEKKDRRHVCNTCGKKYFDAYSLTVHIRTHTGEKPWSCQECGKSFTDSRLLNSHKMTHSSEKRYNCNQCGKRFTHRSTLITHIRTHTGEKPYMCVVCSKAFTQASNLQLHMRTHSGEKPFKCEMCNKSFTSSTILLNHQKTHSRVKPFECKECDKHFVREDLSAHNRIHSNEKPFECAECGKKFRTKSQHKIHQQKHSDSKLYQCEKCNKNWSNISYLNTHLIKHQTENKSTNEEHDKRIVGGYDSDAELTANEALVDDLLASVGIKYDKNESHIESDSDNPKPKL